MRLRKRKSKKAVDPTVLLNKLQTISHGLDGLSKVLFHLDKIGILAVGIYAEPAGATNAQKLVGGVSTIMAYQLAKAANLPASVFGVGSLVKTFKMAYERSRRKELQPYWVRQMTSEPQYVVGLQYPAKWGREYEEYWTE